MATSEILQFASQDTGSNLLTQSEYEGDAQRVIGHQPGIARSKLENKVLRQASLMAAGLAQFMAANQPGDITDGLSAQEIADALDLSIDNKISATGTGGIRLLQCAPYDNSPAVNVTGTGIAAEITDDNGETFIVGGYVYTATNSNTFTAGSAISWNDLLTINGATKTNGTAVCSMSGDFKLAGQEIYFVPSYSSSRVRSITLRARPTTDTFSFKGGYTFLII